MEVPRKPSKLRPYSYPEEMNFPISKYYEPGFMDPLFSQYIRKPCENLTLEATPLTRPEDIRRHRGWTFQKLFVNDPCPEGWTSYESMTPKQREGVKQYVESDPRGYCFKADNEFEPIFYTDKHKWYGSVPMMDKMYQNFPPSKPVKEIKDYAYLTSRPTNYVRDVEKYSLLY